MPKVVYFGSDAICLPGLTFLHEAASGCSVAAIVSQPDRRQGRGKQLQANPVAAYARTHGIPLFQPERPDAQLAQWILGEGIRVAVVMAYGHFLAKALREAPDHGMVNLHGSILPRYRGASPVESAVANGETETGVCLMQVAREMDAGVVADCERVLIGPADTSADVRAKIGRAVVPLMDRNLDGLLSGTLQFSPQDGSLATYCRKIHKEDAALDFSRPARMLYDQLRAFTPWPGGYFDHEQTRIKVGRASFEANEDQVSAPGTVVTADNVLKVATGEGTIIFHTLQRPGGRMLPVRDFLSGYSIRPGDMLIGGKFEPLIRKVP